MAVWRSRPGGENAARRLTQGGDAALQGGALIGGHGGFVHLLDAARAEHTDQRQRHVVMWRVGGHRQDGALVAEDRLDETRRHGADAVLARPGPFDDGDVCVPNLVLDLLPELVDGLAVLAEQIQDRNATHRR